MVRLAGVTRIYPKTASSPLVTALADVDLEVAVGEIYGVIGRSGAGKSTLIRTVNGLERPTSGTVTVDGVEITSLDAPRLRAERRKIGMIFQHFNLVSSRTVFDNVALPLEFAGADRATIAATVDPLLDLVGLADKRARYPVELSGGQKQRVGIARALATRPKVLLSDEATSALDPETTRSILALLSRVNRELGVTILLITHEMEVVKEICDRVGVIDAGRIIEEGTTYDVVTRPKTETARSFLGTLTGRALPPGLAERLLTSRDGAKRAVLRLLFTGNLAEEPTIARLSRRFGTDVAILQAQVDEIAGRPFGSITVALDAAHADDAALDAFLAEAGVAVERIGHVA
ncbi:MAG: methionine ABC transporter ATP-binding protein [Phyllobacteriaceae bacterium]|nr:methionine ABC transporter ATP-binding protein [Phyllobacteriaceae bacterium]